MNLLLIDDEVFALEALRNAVNWNELGIEQVFSCNNISTAKEICTAQNIHIMICDIEMPNGNGIELAGWISENYPDTLVIFLTCHSDFSYAQKAIRCHAFAYLLKPFDLQELIPTVKNAVHEIKEKQSIKKIPENTFQRTEHLLAEEHFWQQLTKGIYQNSDLDYIQSEARRAGFIFVPETSYIPTLFYAVSVPSQDLDFGILSYSIKNVINELFLTTGRPPVFEFEPLCFIALLSEDVLSDKDAWQTNCLRMFQLFREKFSVIMQVLIGSKTDYTSLPKQVSLLSRQADSLKSTEIGTEIRKDTRIVKEIIELIHENKTITREELASRVFLSPDYMAKLFKKETGKRISDYLSEVKLEEAKYRLAQTNQSISDIASALSYNNFSYFSKMFKSEIGMSPGQYRKKYRKF